MSYSPFWEDMIIQYVDAIHIIDKLDDMDKYIIYCKYIEMTQAEIGNTLNYSQTGISYKIRQIKQKLRSIQKYDK